MSRLYLIDDHVLVREGLRALLGAAGHVVVGETADPTQALAEIASLAPEVVLLDLNLGTRSGFEVLVGVTDRDLPVRVIMLTMSAQPRDVAEAMRLGAWGYVLKGSPSDDLLEAVQRVASGQRHLGAPESALAMRALAGDAQRSGGAASLSPRERQVIVMVARGASSSTIGEQLHLSPKTVDTYRSRLMAKLGLADVPALVRWALREGLISLDD
jgi:two-component system invasion response regulator UvrY